MNGWVGACVLDKRAFAICVALTVAVPCGVFAAGVDVSQSGSPSFSYDIAVPPGASGLQPKLSLNYTGERQGLAGVGWSLGGASVIARCAPSKVVDGAPLRVNYNDADKLCLDGQRLIQTTAAGQPLAFPQSNDAASVASNAVREFRLELDSNTRVRAYGSASTGGPAYFKIIGANGQVREYGAAGTNKYNGQPDPVIATGGTSGTTMIWPLVRVTDVSGNWVQFTYAINAVPQATYTDPNGIVPGSMGWPAGSEWLLSRIDYAATPPTRNSVVLTYVDRGVYNGDRGLWYAAGMPQLSTKLLSKVETFVVTGYGDVLARRTKLQYGTGPTTSRSILNSVSECSVNTAGAESCLPATSFGYTPGSVAMATDSRPLVDSAGNANGLDTLIIDDNPSMPNLKYGTLMGDFNGDGRVDILRWSTTPAENKLFLSEGVGNYREIAPGLAAGQFNITDKVLAGKFGNASQKPDGCVQTLVMDFNRDGKADLIRVPSLSGADANGLGQLCNAVMGGSSYLYLSKGDGSFDKQVIRDAATQQPIVLSRSTGADGADKYGNVSSNYRKDFSNYLVADFDGDGYLDILSLRADNAAVLEDAPFPGLWCLNTSVDCGVTLWLGNGDGSFRKVPTPAFTPDPATQSAGANARMQASPGAHTYADTLINGNWVPFIKPSDPQSLVDFKGDGVLGFKLPMFQGWVRGQGAWSLSPSVSNWRFAGPLTATVLPFAGYVIDEANCPLPGDLQGSGRIDYVCTANGALALFRAIDAFGIRSWSSGAAYVYSWPGSRFWTPDALYWMVDVDGDGRSDVLIGNSILRSIGNGAFMNTGSSLSMGNYGWGNYFQNFLGSGGAEYLRTAAGQNRFGYAITGDNHFYSKTDPSPPDQLTSVTSSTGAKTTIGYANTSNASVFASDLGTAKAGSYPVLDINPSMNVVSSVTTDSGVGTATVQTRFGYAGSKVEINGRGFLGFREIRQQADAPDGTSKLTSVKQLVQKHPYIGSVAVSETYQGPLSAMNAPQTGTLLSRVESTYCDTYAAAGAENSASFSAPCPVSSKLQRPYLFKSVQSGVDLAGYATPTTTTTQSYVGGYLSSVLVQTQGAGPAGTENFSKQTGYQYFADDISGENWKVGRVQKSTTSSTVPNSLSAIPTTAGNQPKASATTGQ